MAEASNSQNTSTATEDMTTIQQMKKVYETLKNDEKVNIFGPKGVGKTQIAKRVSERAIRKKMYELAIWVFMCREYTKDSLSKSIARQLFLFPTTEEWEVDDDDKGKTDNDEVEDTEKLIEKLRGKFKGKKILLVLDDVLDDETKTSNNEKKFWSVWDEMFCTDPPVQPKTVLISRSRREGKDIPDKNMVEVKCLPRQVSNSLLLEKLDKQLKKIDLEKIQNLGKTLIEKVNCGDLPGTVTMIAKGLNYFCLDPSGVSMVEKELEEASENYNVSRLLCMKHDVIPIGVFKDLWWHGYHFFRDSGSVHYSELIVYWILEGYLGFGSMTKMYTKGHCILMELMDCGVLKKQEDGYVFMDKSLINVDDLYQCVDQTASLGLATLVTSDIEVFGKTTYDAGMLKTPRRRRKKQSSEENYGQNLSTLLLDGTHFTEQVMLGFLESETKLEVLALFNPTIKSLPKSLGMMEGLRVLVLRGCEFLQDVKLPLKTLQVLEISGARCLTALGSSFFKNMLNLKSLHLSGLQIKHLPQAFYNLHELQWLIIKDCRSLKKLESLSKLERLMVVDLSGNTSLDTVDKNFLKFNKLQTLNLSNTLVSTTPLLKRIENLTLLFCRDCRSLGRLRGLTSLTRLQTIDLSGSTEFEEFHDSSLESLRSLRTINLSRTALDSLPSNISKPCFLYLKSCPKLERLSCLESLENLEVLDLSGSKSLSVIEEKFFDNMTSLRVLNLSETNVKRLPSLSELSNLRELIMSHSPSLVRLPSLEFATKLEILDVSHCHALEDIESKSFDAMTRLQRIDVSETKIKFLPSVSDPQSNLRQLLLKNCRDLRNLELTGPFLNLEELNLSGVTCLKPDGAEFVKDISKLRILNLSYTSLKQLPSLSKLTNLTQLSLAGCLLSKTELNLEPLSKIEVLDLSKSSINRLPNLTNSKNLQKLVLKDCSIVEGFGSPDNDLLKRPDTISALYQLDYLEFPNISLECSPNDMNQNNWNICMLSDIDKPPVFHSGSQFLQILKKDPFQLETSYHLCAIPVKVEGEMGDRYLQRHELVFRDVYLQTSWLSEYKLNKSLQIRGFKDFPNGIEKIIDNVNLVFMIDSELKGLSPGFAASMANKLKGCWIERCHEIITLFDETKRNDNLDVKVNLENLGLCNNCGLESIYKGRQSFGSFDSLKSLFLDGCPKLTNVFPSSWLPKNLQVVEIKHCDKILSLFEAGGELSNLETLHLWDLPALENMGISFPCLQNLKIWECPKLKQTVDKFEVARGLKTLWISGALGLKILHTKHEQINLTTLKLENCPMLESVMSSSSPLACIHTIEIKSCEKMQTLFTNTNDNTTLLNTLQLEDLPMLKTVNAHFPYSQIWNSKG